MNVRGAYTRDRLNNWCRQVLEELDKFESSFLRLDRWLFSGSESGQTLVLGSLECTEIAFGRISLPERDGKLFQSNSLTTGFSAPWAGRRVG